MLKIFRFLWPVKFCQYTGESEFFQRNQWKNQSYPAEVETKYSPFISKYKWRKHKLKLSIDEFVLNCTTQCYIALIYVHYDNDKNRILWKQTSQILIEKSVSACDMFLIVNERVKVKTQVNIATDLFQMHLWENLRRGGGEISK